MPNACWILTKSSFSLNNWFERHSVIVKIFQLSFCEFVPFIRKSLHFVSKSFLFLFLIFVLSVLSMWSLTRVLCYREDCYDLLSQCMDWSRMPAGHNAASLCSLLSPHNPDTPCISLRAFLEPSDNPYIQPQDEVTSPCKGDPCNSSEVCVVNRNCASGRPCRPYQCSKGEWLTFKIK